MQKWFFILIGLFVSAKPLYAQLQLGPIGTWRAHFSNESIGQVIKGDQLYVVAANQIIQIDAKKETTYHREIHQYGLKHNILPKSYIP